MAISGDLSALNLTELFQTLSQSGQQGTLTISDGPRTKRFIFTERGITLETSGEQLSAELTDILLARGTLDQAGLIASEGVAHSKNLSIEDALVDSGAVERSEIDRAMRTQVEEEMYDVFSWPEAQFEFITGAPTDRSGAAPQTRMLFNVSGVLMEAARRLDEWQMIHADIPGLAAVVRLEEPLDAGAYEGVRRTAIPLIDGMRTVSELCAEGHLPKFDICKFLQELVKEGKARVATPAELGEIAERELEGGDQERAVVLLRLALGQAPEMHTLRLALAETLESTGRTGEASRQYRRLGQVKAEGGDPKTAAQILGVACELAPDDDGARADLFKVVMNNTAVLGLRPADLRKQWMPWVKSRAAKGDRAGALAALDELIEEAPDQTELWNLKVQLCKDGGDTAGAVAALQAQMPLLEAQRDTAGITRLCKAILALEPDEPDASQRLAQLAAAVSPEQLEQREAKRGFVLKAVIVVVLIGAAGGAIGWREFQARGAINAARGVAEGLAQSGKFTEAAADVRQVAAEWPWTLAAQGLEVEALGYESKARKAAQAVETQAKADAEAAATQAVTDAAQRLRTEAEAAEAAGRLGKAWQLWDQLIADYPKEPAAQDVTWPVRIVSTPPGAEIPEVAGTADQLPARTPYVLRVDADQRRRVELRLRGFRTAQVTLTRATGERVAVDLVRVALWSSPAGLSPLLGTRVPGGRANDPKLIIGDGAGKLVGLRIDRDGAHAAWTALVPGGSLAPAAGAGLVVTAGGTGELTAIALADGTERWRQSLGGAAVGPPVIAPDGATVYVASDKEFLLAFGADAGAPQWAAPLGTPASGGPCVAGDLILVPTGRGELVAVKSDGSEAWRARLPEPASAVYDAGNGLLCAVLTSGVAGIAVADGAVRWTRPAGVCVGAPDFTAAAVLGASGPRWLLCNTSGDVVALDATDGSEVWRRPLGAGAATGPAGLLAVTLDGALHRLRADGTIAWTQRYASRARAVPPVVLGDLVVVTDSEGGLSAWVLSK